MKKALFILIVLPVLSLGCLFLTKSPWLRWSTIQVALNKTAEEACFCRYKFFKLSQDCDKAAQEESPNLVLNYTPQTSSVKVSFFSWTSVMVFNGESCTLTQD